MIHILDLDVYPGPIFDHTLRKCGSNRASVSQPSNPPNLTRRNQIPPLPAPGRAPFRLPHLQLAPKADLGWVDPVSSCTITPNLA